MKRNRKKIRKQRAKQNRRKTARTYGWSSFFGGLLVCAIAIGPFLLKKYGDDLPMKITEIRVQGNRMLKSTDVKALAGVNEGDPLFGAWVSQVLASLKGNPRVDTVSIYRNATGRVTIALSEKKPFALLHADQLYYVDQDGKVLGTLEARSKDHFDYPVITGPWTSLQDDGLDQRRTEGVQLLQDFLGAGISIDEISEINWNETLGWVAFRVHSKARIIVGEAPFGEKAYRLEYVLKDFEKKEPMLREIDLDFGERVVVKLTEAT